MNLLDLILVAILAVSTVTAFMTGFARAAIGFIAVIGGTLFGFWFYGIPAAFFAGFIKSPTIANILGFIAVFLAFQLAGGIIGKILSKVFKWTGLSWIDKAAGGAFGFVRGSLIAVVFVAVLMAFTPKPPPNWMVGSAVLPYAVDAADWCAALAPRALKDSFRTMVDDTRKIWDEQVKNAEKYRARKKSDSKSELKKIEQ